MTIKQRVKIRSSKR